VVSTYTFDANGNQTAVNAGGSRTTYAYDYENRMRTAIDPGGARSTMAYWADGLRRFLEVGGTRTTFVWDGSDYLQSRTPSEVTTFSTVDAQILDSETGGSESLLVPDPLGSVVKVLDSSGNQVYEAGYWPYGDIRTSVGVNDTSWGYVGTWGYHFDTSRRLYVRARVLDPVTGRWYSVDPLWPQERCYSYADLLPCQMTDLNGLSPGSDLRNCINAWTALGGSARSACLHCKAAQGYKGGFSCDCLSDSGLSVPLWVPPPGPIIPPGPNPIDDLNDCAKKCQGKRGKALANCISKCMGGKERDRDLDELFCIYSPASCPNGEPPKCEKDSIPADKQNCCDLDYFKCLATTKPFAWSKCLA